MTTKFKDLFISYSRRESLGFVGRLHQQLKLADYGFDKVNIPDGDDYAQRINHGIESAHNFVYVMDANTELSYERLLIASLVFAKRLQPAMQGQQNIGLLLPTSVGAIIANLSVLINGKTVVNLNYTAPQKVVELCMEKADIKTILTSKRFLKKLEERRIDMTTLQDHAKFIYLEDVKVEIPKLTLLLGLLKARFLPVAVLKAFYLPS